MLQIGLFTHYINSGRQILLRFPFMIYIYHSNCPNNLMCNSTDIVKSLLFFPVAWPFLSSLCHRWVNLEFKRKYFLMKFVHFNGENLLWKSYFFKREKLSARFEEGDRSIRDYPAAQQRAIIKRFGQRLVILLTIELKKYLVQKIIKLIVMLKNYYWKTYRTRIFLTCWSLCTNSMIKISTNSVFKLKLEIFHWLWKIVSQSRINY